MIKEEKAKAYDKALERAKALYDFYKDNPAQAQKFLDIFPELEESEDERIRKAIVALIEDIQQSDKNFAGVELTDMLVWLEKQKEQKQSINIDQLKSLMLQYLQEAANEKDDSDIEADTDRWARKILEYDFEQKPIEWSEDFEENIRNLLHDKLTGHSEDGTMTWTTFIDDKTLRDIVSGIWFYVGKEALKYPNKELNIAEWSEDDKFKLEDAITGIDVGIGFYEREGKHPNLLKAIIEAKEWLKSLHPQPKQEWSEEDELMRLVVIQTLESFGGRGTTTMQIDWLKSFPKRFNLQPKDEWSEKEQTIIEGACNALEIHGHSKLADKLKSLRPQPKQEWSEEDSEKRRKIKACICYALANVPNEKIKDFGISLRDCLDYVVPVNKGLREETVDLENEAVAFCFDNGINITPYQATRIARHFYELGLNARKDE